jgi:hypothetical protein
MSLILLLDQNIEDDDPAFTTREAYRLIARRDLSPLAPHQRDAALRFSLNAYHVLRLALNNVSAYNTVQGFIDLIRRLRQEGMEFNSGGNHKADRNAL